MHKALTAILTLAALPCLAAQLFKRQRGPASAEDRYIAVRDAAIEKISKLYDDNKFDDAAQKDEDAVRADLLAQMSAIMAEPGRKGFGPAKLNLETFYKGGARGAHLPAVVD